MALSGHGLSNVPGHCELRECLDPEPVDERHPEPLPLLRRVRLKRVEVTLVHVPDNVQTALKEDMFLNCLQLSQINPDYVRNLSWVKRLFQKKFTLCYI